MTVKKDNLTVFIICLAVFVNNISQLPAFVDLRITSPIAIAGWAIALAAVLKNIKIPIYSLLAPGFTVFFCMIFFLFTRNNYLSEINRNFFLSVMLFILGYSYSSFLSEDSFVQIEKSYIVSALIVSVSVWYRFLRDTASIENAQYVYKPKNSLSQIILTVIILSFHSFIANRRPKQKRLFTLLIVLIIMFEIYVLFALRSRATLLGFFLAIVIFLFEKGNNKKIRKYKLLLAFIILIFTAMLFFSERFYTLVFENILLAGRDKGNLDELSSGRVTIIMQFPELIRGNWLTGIGDYYLESFPLAEILNNGILVGFAQIIFAVSPLIWIMLRGKRYLKKQYFVIIITVASAYIINGVFECLAPYGPGAKCSFLWVLFGFMYRRMDWNNKQPLDFKVKNNIEL